MSARRWRALLQAAALAAAAGCTPTPVEPEQDSGLRPDTGGVDAFRDCNAVCTNAVTGCTCSMPCAGHLIEATCTTTSCSCTSDGASNGFSYPFHGCDVTDFIPGCMGRLDAAVVPGDSGSTDGGASDAGADTGADAGP